VLVVDFSGDRVVEPSRVVEGIRRWEPFGFEVRVGRGTSSLKDCPVDWYAHKVLNCQIVLTILGDRPKDAVPCCWGLSFLAQRAFWIRGDARGVDRVRVAAHEAGHIIMNSIAHVMDDTGTMSSPPTHEITSSDRHLIARLTGWPWD
jgi:hypothetical protein